MFHQSLNESEKQFQEKRGQTRNPVFKQHIKVWAGKYSVHSFIVLTRRSGAQPEVKNN